MPATAFASAIGLPAYSMSPAAAGCTLGFPSDNRRLRGLSVTSIATAIRLHAFRER